jgi:hypothetical protein
LTLLTAYAPGLAPEPVKLDLAAARPTVVMSRLPGEPLRGGSLSEQRIKSLAAAVAELHAAVPPEVLADVPPRSGHQQKLIAWIRSWAVPQIRSQGTGKVGQVIDQGLSHRSLVLTWSAARRSASAASGDLCPAPYDRRVDASQQPTLDAIEDRFVALVEGRLSREDADRWAARWVTDDDLVWEDLAWWALDLLYGIDLPASSAGRYLHDDEQVRVWLHELRRRRSA